MSRLSDLLTKNVGLKIAAVFIAIILWSVFRADAPAQARVPDVPIDVLVEDPGWTLVTEPQPARGSVVFRGTTRELLALVGAEPRIVVPIEDVDEPDVVVELRPGMIRIGGIIESNRVVQIDPGTVRLRFEPVIDRLVPVAVRVVGQLPPGVRLTGPIRTEPAVVRVSGGQSRVEALFADSLPLLPFDISQLTQPETLRVNVDTTALTDLLATPQQIQVFVPALAVGDSVIAGDSTIAADTAAGATRAARRLER